MSRDFASSSPPLFIVGCGRSGTTLLRMMLHAHPALSIPQESHFIYRIARSRARGGWPATLDAEGWEHLVTYLDNTPHLDAWEFDRSAVRSRLEALDDHTHGAAFEALFREYLDQQGGTRWGDKTPQHVQYMLLLDRLFPHSRYVHVVRDGRDVALSLMTRKWGPRRMELAGYYWSWLVLSGVLAGELLGPERYREVRFEDLVMHPEATLRQLSAWLDLPYRPEMLDYHATEAAHTYARGGVVARRLTEPPDPSRLYQWRKKMKSRDHRVFVRQAGGLLAYLGYDVAVLPHKQQQVHSQLDTLTQPGVLAATSTVTPFSGPRRLLYVRLAAERAAQGIALVRGNLARFASGSFRWQTTVAAMLD
jgi:hypothetical protein